MQEKKTALIAGASGIVGRGIAERLVGDGWRVLCASRSGGGHLPGTEGVAVDLLDAEACARAVAPHAGITHVFHAAFQPAPSRAAEVAPNLAMLRNVVEAVQQASPALRKVVLVTGAKFYGIQWGASSTPCRESDPRQLPPNFYYDQEDWLREASRSARWRWVNLIPPFVSGYAVGNPMNLVLGIGLYAAVCKELGMPLRFPGSVGAYEALHQIADARQIGAAAAWAPPKNSLRLCVMLPVPITSTPSLRSPPKACPSANTSFGPYPTGSATCTTGTSALSLIHISEPTRPY